MSMEEVLNSLRLPTVLLVVLDNIHTISIAISVVLYCIVLYVLTFNCDGHPYKPMFPCLAVGCV